MPNEISENLLAQAKQQLASGDFEQAAKTATAVLALDESNSEASDILKAASAVTEPIAAEDETQTKTELRRVASEVQSAIYSRNFSEAERLIRAYLVKYPGVTDAAKILSDVQISQRNYNAEENKKREREEQEKRQSLEDVHVVRKITEEKRQEENFEAWFTIIGGAIAVIVFFWVINQIF